MMSNDNDGQMIFGDLGGLKLPGICLTGEEKPRKNLTQETCPDRGSNPGPLRNRRACYRLSHSGGLTVLVMKKSLTHSSRRDLIVYKCRSIVTDDVFSTAVVQWLSYTPLDPRFAGSIPAGVDGFF